MTHVPYKEIPQLYAAVGNGEVQWALGILASAGPMERAGKIRYIGVAAAQPSPYASQRTGHGRVGQREELRVQRLVRSVRPQGHAKALRERIAADVAQVLQIPEVAERYKTLGYNRFDMMPDEFGDYIARETQAWGKVIADAKLKLD